MTVPQFSPVSIPNLPLLGLSDSERSLIAALQSRGQHDRSQMELANAFYMGEQIIENLDIAVSDAVAQKFRTLVGWPRVGVDPYVELLSVEGFRLPSDSDVNPVVGELWDVNGLAAEQMLAYTDAFAMARAYWVVGSRPGGGPPLITVESPLNMAVLWDLTGTKAKAYMQTYVVDGQEHAAVATPEQTITIAQDEHGVWQLVNRDQHKFGRVSVHRMANNPRTNNRDGYSNITPELQSIVTGACRRLLGLEVASELFSAPRMMLMGAQESDFQNPNGEMRKAWDTYISLVTSLERDEDGNLPEVKQLQVYDPATFTKVVEMYASQAAGIIAAVPQDLGLYTQGNPTSSEAWDSMEKRRHRRAIKAQKTFGVPIVEAMKDALRYQNNGVLPAEFERLAVDWAPVMPAKTADDISKLAAANAIPPRSDVTLKHAGFNAVERAQMEQDWKAEDQRSALTAARQQIMVKQAPTAAGGGADGVPAG
jgi:hypothetical protein